MTKVKALQIRNKQLQTIIAQLESDKKFYQKQIVERDANAIVGALRVALINFLQGHQ